LLEKKCFGVWKNRDIGARLQAMIWTSSKGIKTLTKSNIQLSQRRRLRIIQKWLQKSPKKKNFIFGEGDQVVHKFDP
jgi:hypothetical protein